MSVNEEYLTHKIDNIEYYLIQSERLRANQQILAEINLLTEAISKFPEVDKLYLLLGIAHDKATNFDAVIDNYSQAIALKPQQAFWVYAAITERLQWKNRLQEAIDFSTQGIELYPQQAELYRQFGIVQEKLGHKSKAIALYQTAIKLAATQPIGLYVRLLKLLKDSQDFEQFNLVYQQFIDLYPEHSNADIYAELGDYFYYQDDWRNALDAYCQSLAIEPQQELIRYKVNALHFNLGINLLERKNLLAAIKQFEQLELIKEKSKLLLNWPSQDSCLWPHAKWNLAKAFDSLLPDNCTLPKITIVTPSYNQAEYIEETILSVLNQEYENLEYIVVDGLSEDNTPQILQQYQEQIEHIIIEADDGQSDAINKGFNLATGELMMWLNSDDLLFPGALHMLALTYLNNKCDLIAGTCVVHRNEEIIALRKPKVQQENFTVANLSNVLHSWAPGHFFFQPETIFTRELWSKIGGQLDIELHYAMDHDLWLKFAQAGAQIKIIGYPIALFRKHQQQKTANSLASITELTKVVEQYHHLDISNIREQIIAEKIQTLQALVKPKIAILYSKEANFSQQINDELKAIFIHQEISLLSGIETKNANLEDYDLIIIIPTSQTPIANILSLQELNYRGLLVAWLWTKENDYYLNGCISNVVDICIPKSKLLGKIIKNNYSYVSSYTNICLTECSLKEGEQIFKLIIKKYIFDDILTEEIIKQEKVDNISTFDRSRVFWVGKHYFESTFEQRYAQIAKHKVFVFHPQPLENSHLAILEALLCGLIVIVVGKMSNIDELFSPQELKYLSILSLDDDDPEKLSETIAQALFLFDQQGNTGRIKRHNFILDNHLLINRLKSLFKQLSKISTVESNLSIDTLNKPINIDIGMTENQLEVRPNSTQPLSFYLETAQDLLDEEPQQAVSLCQTAIKLYPENSAAYRQLGVAQEKQGDITGQINSYSKAIALDSDQPFWVYCVLVDRLQTNQQLEQAIEIAQQGLELYPDQAELYRNLGVVQDYQRDTQNVIKNYSKAIELDQQQPFWVYCALAEHLCWKGRATEAERVAKQGLEIHPNRASLFRYLGLALQKQRKPNEAIKNYTLALQYGLEQPKAVYEALVNLYRESNKLKKAIDICQQGIEVLPDEHKSEFVAQLRNLTFLSADQLPAPVPTATAVVAPPKTSNPPPAAQVDNSNNVCTKLSNDEYIRYIYKALLKRQVDPKGLKSNLKALDNGVPRTLLLENILNSAEFTSLGNQQILTELSDQQFLGVIWELLLGRGCDANAQKTYLDHLAKGLSRTQLLLEILKTGEFKNRIENLGLLDETIERNTGSVWIMGTEQFITQGEWDRQLLNVLCDRLSNQADLASINQPRECTSEVVKQYISQHETPLVSVITSLFKGRKFIQHFLENITTQTIFQGMELIIIDANSPENEFEIIEQYIRKYNNIRYLRTEKVIGIYEAWNIGVKQSRGQFLTNANLDDLRRFDCLEKQAEALLLNPDVDLVYPDILYSLTPNLPVEVIEQCGFKTNLPDLATKEIMLEYNPPHSAPMWRKTIHDRVGLFNTGYRSGGDYELWMRALLKNAKFIKNKEAIAVYYNNPSGISTRQESHGSYEAREIQTIYQTLFQEELFAFTPEDFVKLSQQRLDLSGDIKQIENSTKAWQGKITVLDKIFIEKLKEMSKTKFYLPLNN